MVVKIDNSCILKSALIPSPARTAENGIEKSRVNKKYIHRDVDTVLHSFIISSIFHILVTVDAFYKIVFKYVSISDERYVSRETY